MLILRPIFGRAGRPGGGPLVNRWAALAIPVLVFLLVCFLAPLVIMAVRSVTDLPTGSEGDPLANFRRFFGGEANLRVLGNTFWIAGFSTLGCLVIGYPFAYLMRLASPRWAGLLLIAVLVPFWSSLLVRTYAWQVILRDTGLINSTLSGLGPDRRAARPVPDHDRRAARHDPDPAAVHGPAAVHDDGPHRPGAHEGRGEPRCLADPGVPARVPAALDPGRAGGLAAGVRPGARLLHHARPARLARRTRCSARSSRRGSSSSSTGGSRARWRWCSIAVTLVVLFLASRVIRVRDVFGALDAE